jgi:hypothetical protein
MMMGLRRVGHCSIVDKGVLAYMGGQLALIGQVLSSVNDAFENVFCYLPADFHTEPGEVNGFR